jgi:hypothetical protein
MGGGGDGGRRLTWGRAESLPTRSMGIDTSSARRAAPPRLCRASARDSGIGRAPLRAQRACVQSGTRARESRSAAHGRDPHARQGPARGKGPLAARARSRQGPTRVRRLAVAHTPPYPLSRSRCLSALPGYPFRSLACSRAPSPTTRDLEHHLLELPVEVVVLRVRARKGARRRAREGVRLARTRPICTTSCAGSAPRSNGPHRALNHLYIHIPGSGPCPTHPPLQPVTPLPNPQSHSVASPALSHSHSHPPRPPTPDSSPPSSLGHIPVTLL